MRIPVSVKFNKDFIRFEGDKLVIGIKAKPEKGKANEEVVEKIARHFKVPVSRVKIIFGRTSRIKLVDIK